MNIEQIKAAIQILEKHVAPDEDVFHAEHTTDSRLEMRIGGTDMETLDELGWGQ